MLAADFEVHIGPTNNAHGSFLNFAVPLNSVKQLLNYNEQNNSLLSLALLVASQNVTLATEDPKR